MTEKSWNTSISEIKPNEVRLRGYRIDELMGQISFCEAIHLALMGEIPSPEVGALLDAMLVSSIDHGTTPPSTQAARITASTGSDLNHAIATGVLSINQYHGGAIYNCMGVLQEGLERAEYSGLSIEEAASQLVVDYSARKVRIAGLGHRYHTDDPRTKKLFSLAEELGLAGDGIYMIKAIRSSISAQGKDLPINVDGALAALLVDLKIPRELANAFFIMARVPGLTAHVYEEQTQERPMRRIDPTKAVYNGPESRTLNRD
ncbi:MAG: citryl-CoA lyase [Anaerolineales bacterium]|nr:citryl-CoA lyase [Anaerolineales bacterium]